MRFVRWWALIGSLCVAVGIFFFAGCMQNPYGEYSSGVLTEREYYLFSPSSQAAIQAEVELCDCFSITGEKAVFVFETEEAADRYAMKLLKTQGATVVFEEAVAGARCIYAQAKRMGAGVRIGGAYIHLHIVISGKRVQVGTPIVFGGY